MYLRGTSETFTFYMNDILYSMELVQCILMMKFLLRRTFDTKPESVYVENRRLTISRAETKHVHLM